MLELPNQLLVLWLAIVLDLLLGEPPNSIHPVAWLGRAILAFQRHAPKRGRWIPFTAGTLFVMAGLIATSAAGVFVHLLLSTLPYPFDVMGEAVALKYTFSIRGLARAGTEVQSALECGDLVGARRLLSWHLVSRDTSSLDESQVAAAAIESLSENASDSCIGPLLCFALGGLPGAFAYRFINTCDAMLGYRDLEREWLGKAAARLDDFINLVPSRLTAGLIIVVGIVFGSRPTRAVYVWFRDRNLTDSPNAGHPMSAAAGVLGIQLEKIGHYRLGDGQRQPASFDIARAQSMLGCAALLAIVSLSAILLLVQ